MSDPCISNIDVAHQTLSSVCQPQWQMHQIFYSMKKGTNICFGCSAALSCSIFGVIYLGGFVLFLPIFCFPVLRFSLPFQPAKNLRNTGVKIVGTFQSVCFDPFWDGKWYRMCLVGQGFSRLLPFKSYLYAPEKCLFFSLPCNSFSETS